MLDKEAILSTKLYWVYQKPLKLISIKCKRFNVGKEYKWEISQMRCKPKSSRKQPRRKKESQKNMLNRSKTAGNYISRANKNSKCKIRSAKARKPKYCECSFSEYSKLTNEELDLTFK